MYLLDIKQDIFAFTIDQRHHYYLPYRRIWHLKERTDIKMIDGLTLCLFFHRPQIIVNLQTSHRHPIYSFIATFIVLNQFHHS